jgi:hypothetical protein
VGNDRRTTPSAARNGDREVSRVTVCGRVRSRSGEHALRSGTVTRVAEGNDDRVPRRRERPAAIRMNCRRHRRRNRTSRKAIRLRDDGSGAPRDDQSVQGPSQTPPDTTGLRDVLDVDTGSSLMPAARKARRNAPGHRAHDGEKAEVTLGDAEPDHRPLGCRLVAQGRLEIRLPSLCQPRGWDAQPQGFADPDQTRSVYGGNRHEPPLAGIEILDEFGVSGLVLEFTASSSRFDEPAPPVPICVGGRGEDHCRPDGTGAAFPPRPGPPRTGTRQHEGLRAPTAHH